MSGNRQYGILRSVTKETHLGSKRLFIIRINISLIFYLLLFSSLVEELPFPVSLPCKSAPNTTGGVFSTVESHYQVSTVVGNSTHSVALVLQLCLIIYANSDKSP